MDWMLTHQLSSKNLSTGEKLAMTEEFQKEVALENEKKKSEAQKTFQGNQHVDFTPIGVNSKIDGRKDSWTDSQTAKKLGRCIKELERIYGVEHGGNRKSSPKVSDLNQSDIAEMIGISVDTLNNYKLLAEMIPELEENWHKKNAKNFLDKLGKWCYDFTNDKDYKSCQLQLSNK